MSLTRLLVYITNIIMGIIKLLIGIRIILTLFNANETAPFAQFIYEHSEPLLLPFQGIFPTIQLDGRFEIELTAVFALFIYTIVSYFIIRIIQMLGGRDIQR